jgi:hypothetical protein
MSVPNYKIFCNNHNKYFYLYSNIVPTDCPFDGTHQVRNVAEIFNKFDNLEGVVDPTNTNDVREGYGVNSRWINTTNNKTYICSDNEEKSAQWELNITNLTLPDVLTDTLVSFTGTVNASGIQTTSGAVVISNVAPTVGQILVASDGSNASWENTIKYPSNSKDKEIVVFSGESGNVITGSGIRHYGALGVDPVNTQPSPGDKYYNTVINHEMVYDGNANRGWLSVATFTEGCGANRSTAENGYYRRFNGMVLSQSKGVTVQKGMIIGISVTTNTTANRQFKINISTNPVTTFTYNIANATYVDMDLANSFDAGVMSMQNGTGGSVQYLQATVFYKLRV